MLPTIFLCSYLETYVVLILFYCLHLSHGQSALFILGWLFNCYCFRFFGFHNLCYGFEILVQYRSCSITSTSWQAPWMDRLVFNFISIPICNYVDKDAYTEYKDNCSILIGFTCTKLEHTSIRNSVFCGNIFKSFVIIFQCKNLKA